MEGFILPNTQYWQLSISEPGAVVTDLQDVKQCIDIILRTVKTTDPLRPEFGVDILQYIDKPTTVSIPGVRQAIYEAITLWEPRATITNIISKPNATGQVIFEIYWTTDAGSDTNTITV